MGRLFAYHLRLAARSLRRNANLSLAMFISLALATSLWGAVIEHYLRIYGPPVPLSPGLHQVELPHSTTLRQALGNSNAAPSANATRLRVTYPEYEALAGTGIPARQTAAVRSRLLVATGDGAPAVAVSRFVNADFFALFAIDLATGRGFSREEEARGDAVVVIGAPLARKLGGRALDRTLLVDGKEFRVVGVVAGDQRYRPEWDLATLGGNQDVVYVPFAWCRRLLARPETVLFQSAVGPRFDQLFASDAVFVSFWVELPTAESAAAYTRFLDASFRGRGIAYTLRPYAAWLVAFALPDSSIRFFLLLTGLVLLGGGLNMTRLLLAKGLARRDELGIHRALGASRRSLFARQILEAAMLSLPAALAGVLMALPFHHLFNVLVADTDIPVHLTLHGFFVTLGAAVATGLGAALYPAWQVSRTPPTIYMGRS
jgi:putative ABC transport system permease protein